MANKSDGLIGAIIGCFALGIIAKLLGTWLGLSLIKGGWWLATLLLFIIGLIVFAKLASVKGKSVQEGKIKPSEGNDIISAPAAKENLLTNPKTVNISISTSPQKIHNSPVLNKKSIIKQQKSKAIEAIILAVLVLISSCVILYLLFVQYGPGALFLPPGIAFIVNVGFIKRAKSEIEEYKYIAERFR